jgi:hypothetical protein
LSNTFLEELKPLLKALAAVYNRSQQYWREFGLVALVALRPKSSSKQERHKVRVAQAKSVAARLIQPAAG